VTDRLKDMIIFGGGNIYNAELDRVLLECDSVAGAAVFAVPDERWGESPLSGSAISRPTGVHEGEAAGAPDRQLLR
jgi:fatty-acyl-CoA synthase